MFAMDISNDTRRICDMMQACPIGELLSLDAMSQAIGRDIRQARSIIYSAEKIARRECGAVFENVRGKGYVRLHVNDLARIGKTARTRIRNQSRRGAKTIASGLAGANDVDPKALRGILAEQSVLGMLEHISRDKSLPKIDETDSRPLPLAIALKGVLEHIKAA